MKIPMDISKTALVSLVNSIPSLVSLRAGWFFLDWVKVRLRAIRNTDSTEEAIR